MFTRKDQFEPLLPQVTPELASLSHDLVRSAASLAGSIHPLAGQELVPLVRVMNCFYSNLIEGHRTLPLDIERALNSDFSSDHQQLRLQRMALAHIHTEEFLEGLVGAGTDPSSIEYLKEAHRQFCSQLDRSDLTLEDGRMVVPGEFRTHEVQVGHHIAPIHSTVAEFMHRFQDQYAFKARSRDRDFVWIGAAHHRLLWVHPFSDGNGRVARLMTGSMLREAGLTTGLWSLSRGFAKHQDEYKAKLAQADQARRGDLDGRGNLSQEALQDFAKFFLTTSLDQVAFMQGMLALDGLRDRMRNYFQVARPDLKPQSAFLLEHLFAFGEMPRGEAERITGYSERPARDILSTLQKEGFLGSETEKGPVRIRFPVKCLGYFFPNLFPAGSLDVDAPGPSPAPVSYPRHRLR